MKKTKFKCWYDKNREHPKIKSLYDSEDSTVSVFDELLQPRGTLSNCQPVANEALIKKALKMAFKAGKVAGQMELLKETQEVFTCCEPENIQEW